MAVATVVAAAPRVLRARAQQAPRRAGRSTSRTPDSSRGSGRRAAFEDVSPELEAAREAELAAAVAAAEDGGVRGMVEQRLAELRVAADEALPTDAWSRLAVEACGTEGYGMWRAGLAGGALDSDVHILGFVSGATHAFGCVVDFDAETRTLARLLFVESVSACKHAWWMRVAERDTARYWFPRGHGHDAVKLISI